MAGKVWADLSNFFNSSGGYTPGADKKLDSNISKVEKNSSETDAINNKIDLLKKKSEKNLAESDRLLDMIATAKADKDEAEVKRLGKEQERVVSSGRAFEDALSESRDRLIELNEKNRVLYEKIVASGKLSKEQLEMLVFDMKENDGKLEASGKGLKDRLSEIHGHAQNGFSGILASTKSFFSEFAIVGELMHMAFHQIEALNKDLVAFNRSISLGSFNNSMFGIDLNGNSQNGMASLTSISMQNAISEKEFLSSFQAFSRGKAMGTSEKDFMSQQDDMNKFGIQAAQLSKFYGVEMGTINTITSNLVYNFGTKVKDLNGILESGKEAAAAAGVSVKEYFNNLREATDMIGKYYIKDGIEGMKDLALYATQTNQTVGQVLASSDRFKNFTSQFELQNTAAALGFANASANMVRAWGYSIQGDKAESQKLFLSSIAKDLTNNGGAVDGKFTPQGMMNMQSFNMNEEEIKSVQRLLNMQHELGISIDDLTNRNKLEAEQKAKIYEFEHRNLTIGERMSELWGKIRTIIIDPLASLFTPVINGLLAIGNMFADFLYTLSPIIWPLQMFGRGLSFLVKGLEYAAGIMEPLISKVNQGFKYMDEHLGKFGKGIIALLGILEIGIIAKPLMSLATGVLTRITSLFGGVSKLFVSPTQSLTAAGGGLRGAASELVVAARELMASVGIEKSYPSSKWIPGLGGPAPIRKGLLGVGTTEFSANRLMKGVGIGAGISVVGNLIGAGVSASGHEQAGGALSMGADIAGIGATIGAFFGPLAPFGIAIGAGLGFLGGAIYGWIDADKDNKKNADEDKFDGGAATINFVNSKSIEDMLKKRQVISDKYDYNMNGNGNVPTLAQTSKPVIHHVTIKAVSGQTATTIVKG